MFVFLWLISLRIIPSRSIHIAAKWHYFILFLGWIIFHCIYILHFLYSQNGCSWLRGISPPSDESETQTPNVLWACQAQHVAVEAFSHLYPVAEREKAGSLLCARSISGTWHFCSHSIGVQSYGFSQWEETGKCGLAMCPEEEDVGLVKS